MEQLAMSSYTVVRNFLDVARFLALPCTNNNTQVWCCWLHLHVRGVLTRPAQLTNMSQVMCPRLVSRPETRPAFVNTCVTLHRSTNCTPAHHSHDKMIIRNNNLALGTLSYQHINIHGRHCAKYPAASLQ